MPGGEYGYDAPYAPAVFAFISAATGVGAAFVFNAGEPRAAAKLAAISVFFFLQTLSYLYTTRRGKHIEWAAILDRLQLRGDEHVLDMGCGRGAVMIAVAHRLKTGHVTGIDIWSTRDQSGNRKEVTERNASLEGVADRVEVQTGDMRALPFPDSTFDLVVSSLAIHNIPNEADRRKAVAEGFRVLKPGGRVVVADIRATDLYEDALRTLGASSIARRRLGWRFWWGNPIAATTLVTASKPSA